MLNIIIPMAGRGSRFVSAGYTLPKPLIPIHKKPMIQCVVENIAPKCEHKFIFLCLTEHLRRYELEKTLRDISPTSLIVEVKQVTQGAACTILLAAEYIDNDNAIMIANSDQYIDANINEYLTALGDNDGLIMTMTASDAKWSYIQYDNRGLVLQVREKEVISNEATVGIYNYRHGRDFVLYAEQMISKNIRVNGEFYVAPVYNEMIADGKKVSFQNIGTDSYGMYGLGIPEDLETFRELPQSKKC